MKTILAVAVSLLVFAMTVCLYAAKGTVAQPASDERVLWCLMKGQQRAEAVARVISGIGIDLRYLWNGDLRASQLYRDDEELQAAAGKMRDDLLAKGWVDPASLGWSR